MYFISALFPPFTAEMKCLLNVLREPRGNLSVAGNGGQGADRCSQQGLVGGVRSGDLALCLPREGEWKRKRKRGGDGRG